MVNSKQKGCRGERDWRDFLKKHGYDAKRSQQYCGISGDADVVCRELDPLFHQEVKRVERLNIHEAINQTKKDCPNGKWRIVAHRKNKESWLVTMPAEDWIDLIKSYLELCKL